MKDKAKMIERALGQAMVSCFDWAKMEMVSVRDVAKALAKQAIVIECQVKHEEGWPGVQAHTSISFPGLEEYRDCLTSSPLDFPPGKALCIIVSLADE